MIKFIHHLLNPHCPECKLEREENKVCQSCETLKQMNDHLRIDNEKLLRRILEKPEPEIVHNAPEITRPRSMPWAVKRQMLEQEDRIKAQLMNRAPIPTEDLEKELLDATATREAEKS